MSRHVNRLTARKVATVTEAGLYADGHGLYLRISKGKSSGRRWVFIYRRRGDGKRCEMGLGSSASVSLARAREKAAEVRALLAEGKDPALLKQQPLSQPTFGDLADRYVAAMASSWRNAKHREQWAMTLKVYAAPLRPKRVDEITTADVVGVLQPIWQAKSETASRLRGRIEKVLDLAKAQGFRSGENPAAWRGHLELILPKRPRLTRGHHARLPMEELVTFVHRLRERRSVAARCLEFTILTAARSGEAINARWQEIDLDARVWTIPAQRMKAGREHRIPLSENAVQILKDMRCIQNSEFVFPGQRLGRPLSSMALSMVLRRMNAVNVTVHGFRSCFRDWAGNCTSFPRELAEHALAHVIGDKAEQAYRRDDALERRRPMMEAWSELCRPRHAATLNSAAA